MHREKPELQTVLHLFPEHAEIGELNDRLRGRRAGFAGLRQRHAFDRQQHPARAAGSEQIVPVQGRRLRRIQLRIRDRDRLFINQPPRHRVWRERLVGLDVCTRRVPFPAVILKRHQRLRRGRRIDQQRFHFQRRQINRPDQKFAAALCDLSAGELWQIDPWLHRSKAKLEGPLPAQRLRRVRQQRRIERQRVVAIAVKFSPQNE